MDDLVPLGGKDTLNGLSGDDVVWRRWRHPSMAVVAMICSTAAMARMTCQGSFGDDTITNCEGASAAGTSSDEEGLVTMMRMANRPLLTAAMRSSLPLVNNKQ
ncbi:hypothetical protein KFU94_36655 [Chloroflexi bacterium TSY]|nr:hypothetical protein [Chloroflexi bacterium TSY]